MGRKIGVDAISDLHMNNFNEHSIRSLFGKNKENEILLLGGDIINGSDNSFSVYGNLIKVLKTVYSTVLVVLGNHERFIYDMSISDIDKNYKKAIELNGGILLDGSVFKHDSGLIIGGVSMFGSVDYIRILSDPVFHFPGFLEKEYMKTFKGVEGGFPGLADSYFWDNPLDLFKEDYNKLIEVSKYDCHIIVTHVSPLTNNRSICERYRGLSSTAHFCFDGKEIFENNPPKLWLSGHSHNRGELDSGQWDNIDFYDISATCESISRELIKFSHFFVEVN